MSLSFKRTARILSLGFAVAMATTTSAHASLINIQSSPANSTEGLGTFAGTLEYTADIGSGTLTVSLTNTSLLANGGLITGFVFNIKSTDDGKSGTLMTGATHTFLNTGSGSAPPFGNYDAGAALGGNWTGGGSPNGGIAVGATGAFTFNITASDAALLTATSFISGPNAFDFVVRFRGFVDGGSDKVPGVVVPGPSAMALVVMGLARSHRRRAWSLSPSNMYLIAWKHPTFALRTQIALTGKSEAKMSRGAF